MLKHRQSEPKAAPGSTAPSPGILAQPVFRAAAVAGVLIVALLIRTFATVTHPNLIWPDEIYQTVEPARHLVFGPWIRSWEWVVGMRSWLVPGLLAGPLWLGRLVDPTGPTAATFVTALMIVLSLTPVIIGYLWGERLRGPAGGLFVAGLAAVWPDLIYMAPHPLVDVLASHLLLIALYAAFPLTAPPTNRRLALAGALFGLTVYLRMQLGPAVAMAAGLAAGTSPARWRSVLCSGGLALAALGGFDWVTLGTPFQSIWLNFWFNIVGKVSNEFGVNPPMYYITLFNALWGPTFIFAFSIILIDYKKHGPLLLVLATVILTQSLVGHKEWRFIFPALPIIVLLLAFRLLEAEPHISRWARQRRLPTGSGPACVAAAAGLLGLAIAINPMSADAWNTRSAMLKAFAEVRRQPGVCGVGLLFFRGAGANQSWVAGPGGTALPPRVPLLAADPAGDWKSAASYTAAIIEDGDKPPPPFHLVRCAEPGSGNPTIPGARTCLWERSGGCDPQAAQPLPVNWPSYFLDAAGRIRRERLTPSLLGLRPTPREPLYSAGSAAR